MAASKDTTGRGRPRLEQTDRRILDAALRLLRADGPRGVTVDAVSAASGVARTTIYRRYKSRDELIGSLLDSLVDPDLPPPELPVPAKLRWVLEQVLVVLEDGIGRGGTAAVLIDSDPAFTNALQERLASRLRSLTRAIAADVEAGRLKPDLDPETLVGLLFGAYLSEILLHGAPRDAWLQRTADFLVPAVAREAAGQ